MTRVGQYRLLERIGEGGMGAVFRGEDTMLQRQVAIKVLRPELSKQKTLVERFRTEAVALARLNHPNIATVYGLLQEEGQYYMVLEFVDGQTLESMLSKRGALPWREAVRIAKDTLAALDHAHRMGVVHRDLKPSNLMLNRLGQVKVMDFGIARLAGTSRHTEYGRIVGTPLYMSPEQLRGEEVDGRSDVYSLGVVLYELLTGREAFQADSDYALLMAQLNTMPEPASRYVPGIPVDLETALQRSLQKAKTDRWKSAADYRRALNTILPEPVTKPTEEVLVPIQPQSPAKETVVAIEDDAPAPTVPVAETGETPVTRLADPAPVPATRLASPPVGPTRVAVDPEVGPARMPVESRPRRRTAVLAGAGLVAAIAVWAITRPSRPTVPPAPPPSPALETRPAPPPPTPAPGPVTVAANPPVTVERPSPPAPPPTNFGEIVEPGAPPRAKTPAQPPRGGPNPPAPPPPAPPPATGGKPPVAPEPPPVVATPEPGTGADLSAEAPAFKAGLARIAGWLKGKDAAAVERTFTGAEKEALLKLVRQFPVEIEKDAFANASAAGANRAAAEFTATLKWRSSFGATRRVPVKIAASYVSEGGSWSLTSWRFLGKIDLD
jgi:serine/threonine-protein kinase